MLTDFVKKPFLDTAWPVKVGIAGLLMACPFLATVVEALWFSYVETISSGLAWSLVLPATLLFQLPLIPVVGWYVEAARHSAFGGGTRLRTNR